MDDRCYARSGVPVQPGVGHVVAGIDGFAVFVQVDRCVQLPDDLKRDDVAGQVGLDGREDFGDRRGEISVLAVPVVGEDVLDRPQHKRHSIHLRIPEKRLLHGIDRGDVVQHLCGTHNRPDLGHATVEFKRRKLGNPDFLRDFASGCLHVCLLHNGFGFKVVRRISITK